MNAPNPNPQPAPAPGGQLPPPPPVQPDPNDPFNFDVNRVGSLLDEADTLDRNGLGHYVAAGSSFRGAERIRTQVGNAVAYTTGIAPRIAVPSGVLAPAATPPVDAQVQAQMPPQQTQLQQAVQPNAQNTPQQGFWKRLFASWWAAPVILLGFVLGAVIAGVAYNELADSAGGDGGWGDNGLFVALAALLGGILVALVVIAVASAVAAPAPQPAQPQVIMVSPETLQQLQQAQQAQQAPAAPAAPAPQPAQPVVVVQQTP